MLKWSWQSNELQYLQNQLMQLPAVHYELLCLINRIEEKLESFCSNSLSNLLWNNSQNKRNINHYFFFQLEIKRKSHDKYNSSRFCHSVPAKAKQMIECKFSNKTVKYTMRQWCIQNSSLKDQCQEQKQFQQELFVKHRVSMIRLVSLIWSNFPKIFEHMQPKKTWSKDGRWQPRVGNEVSEIKVWHSLKDEHSWVLI